VTGSRSAVDVVRAGLSGFDGVVAVTGATGWLGSVALDLLYAALGAEAPRRVVGLASAERRVTVADGRLATVLPLAALPDLDPTPAALLHFAFLTPDHLEALGPSSTSPATGPSRRWFEPLSACSVRHGWWS
jgi:hypothetical protein